jgi:WD40 repeat protein
MHVVLVHQASVVRYFKGHSDAVMSVQWSPHFDNYFVSASNDNTVVLWDINGTAISSVPDHSSARAGA